MRERNAPFAARIAKTAARQHGAIARRQLLEVGMSSATISRWIHAGHLHPVHRGVYAVGFRSLSLRGIWMAAVLACGEHSALSHTPAGQLAGFIDRRERTALHVSVTNQSHRRPPGIVIHRPRSLPPCDLAKRHHIPTTTPARTLWDLSPVLPSQQLRRAFARAERHRPVDRARLSQLLAAAPSHKGAATIRELVTSRRVPLSEVRSWLEELLMLVCSEHRLPFPAVNVPLLGYEVDFLWPAARLVVEADGGDHLDPIQRDTDNERDATLGRAGYLVRRYSYHAMGREAEVAREIGEILAERLEVQLR